MGMTQLVRKASIACAAILAFVGLTAGLASAAPPGTSPAITVVSPSPAEGAGIGRADLDGTNINNSFISGLFHPSGLALGAST